MKKSLSIMALAAIAVTFGSCSSDNQNGEPQVAPKYITVSTNINSRTTINADGSQVFASGDKISVYAWVGSATEVPATLVVNNSLNTFDGTSWAASPQMLWRDMVQKHYFLGVYPTRAITDFKADAYALDVANQEASDILVAKNLGGQEATTAAVPLTFNHAMAKLVVNLTFRNQWGGTPTVGSVKALAKKTATLDYLADNIATATGEAAEIDLPVINANTKYTSIMVPQTGSFTSVVITIDNVPFTFTQTDGIALEAGKITTVNLIVGRQEIVMGDVSINSWVEGDSLNGGEAQED